MKTKQLKVAFLAAGISLFSCSKEDTNPKEVDSNFKKTTLNEQVLGSFNTPFENTEQLSAYAGAMKEVLIMAKDPELRTEVFERALLQESGDYDFKLVDFQQKIKSSRKYQKEVTNLTNSIKKIKEQDLVEPILFYPRAEVLESEVRETKSVISGEQLGQPIAVFRNVYDENYDSPGYTLDENNNLVFSHMVSEEEAWTSDVYVLGQSEEYLMPSEPWAGGGGSGGGGGSTPQYRNEGRAEYGGVIQFTDLNAVEHWTDGKIEMRLIVTSASGTIIKDQSFPKRARSNYQNDRWADKNVFYFNWNSFNVGNFNIEKWIERDGGNSAEVSINIPAAYEGGPTTTVKIPSEDRDDDLGQSIVQFSDRIGQVYSISYMNFKRK